MRILVVSQYFWPEHFRVNEITEFLRKKKCDVDILTGVPNYPDGKVFQKYLKSTPNIPTTLLITQITSLESLNCLMED